MFVGTNRIKIKKGYGKELEELFRSRVKSLGSLDSWISSCGGKKETQNTRNILWSAVGSRRSIITSGFVAIASSKPTRGLLRITSWGMASSAAMRSVLRTRPKSRG